MATSEPPLQRLYHPDDPDPRAPRLHVARNGDGWELRDGDGALLGRHPTQRTAVDAALEQSRARFSEILVRGHTGEVEWLVDQDRARERLRRSVKRARRRPGVKNPRFNAGLRLICTSRWLVPGREPPVELFYDPADLDPKAPRLHVGMNDGRWEVRNDCGAVLSRHSSLPDAIDAAAERSDVCFTEILVRESTGRQEWSVHHNQEWIALIRLLVRTAPSHCEAAD